MIRSRVVTVVDPLEELIGFADNIISVVEEIQQEVYDEIQPILLYELQHYPGPAKHPFEFATKKSRQWYFWAIKEKKIPTDGKRYIRQYKFRDSWEIDLEKVGAAEWQLVVKNSYSATKYIVGTFDKRRDYRVPGHINTGWLLVRETVKFWQNAFIEEFTKRFNQYIHRTQAKLITRITNR